MPGVKLTTQAYCKMVLHGAKYPHCAVNGLLVAEKQKPRREHPAAHTLFVDCIPLFHGTLALAPMLEVALTLLSADDFPALPSACPVMDVPRVDFRPAFFLLLHVACSVLPGKAAVL